MQLRKFLNKKTAKKTKLKVLNKMLKIAKANGGTISVEKAREVVKEEPHPIPIFDALFLNKRKKKWKE